MDIRPLVLLALVAGMTSVSAQVYRWVDEKGSVHYSNTTPPPGVKARVVDPDGKPGAPSADSMECYTVRCQGERLERRPRRRHRAVSTSAATCRSTAA